jgi:hypothetical protein
MKEIKSDSQFMKKFKEDKGIKSDYEISDATLKEAYFNMYPSYKEKWQKTVEERTTNAL